MSWYHQGSDGSSQTIKDAELSRISITKGMPSTNLQDWKAATSPLLPQKRRWYDAGGFPYRSACTKQTRYAPGCLYPSRWLPWLRKCAQRTQVYLKLMIIRVNLQFLYRRPNQYKRKLSEWDIFTNIVIWSDVDIFRTLYYILLNYIVQLYYKRKLSITQMFFFQIKIKLQSFYMHFFSRPNSINESQVSGIQVLFYLCIKYQKEGNQIIRGRRLEQN
ncbi:Hypothetical_protein [Hexamita inflata]|uniref:Hypothetical_protein n=1 Tax=Hexamita inflata TaxID=28002 RepID=A0AA86TRC7_9EUKA|nr:Hypothetical protein HINF_LOCUS7743 [Hexamita inflata]